MNYARTIEKHVDVSIFRTRTGRQKCRGSKVRCPARSTTLTAALARLWRKQDARASSVLRTPGQFKSWRITWDG